MGQAPGTQGCIGFTKLSNGFASCDDPAGLQEICDRLQPGTIEVFVQRWLHRLPMPFGPADRDAGYWWECSMRQVEVWRTVVFDAPRRARWFFEALISDNLDLHRPEFGLVPEAAGKPQVVVGGAIRGGAAVFKLG